jgi:putative toxin-antitoxin system antitoxin component (TIGR02293 family)
MAKSAVRVSPVAATGDTAGNEAEASAVARLLAETTTAPTTRARPEVLRSLEAEAGYSEAEIFALVVPKRTLARRKARGEALTIEETDKAMRLARIAATARRVFGDEVKAHRWLRQPKRSLDNQTPLAYLASESGARLVEDMLHQIEHGISP